MIQILDEKIKKSQKQIENEHPNCKYLLLMENIIDESGYLYAVSTEKEEHGDFCKLYHSLVDKECKFRNLYCALLGSYYEVAIVTLFECKGDTENGSSN